MSLHRILGAAAFAVLGFAPGVAFAATNCSTIVPTAAAVSGGAPSSSAIIGQFTNAQNDVNGIIQFHQGSTPPANPCAFEMWANTGVAPTALNQWDGSNWIAIGYLDQTSHLTVPIVGGGAGSLAAASTTDLGSDSHFYIAVSGSGQTIGSLGSTAALGTMKIVGFAGANTLTNSSGLLLPGSANIATASGDWMLALKTAAGWTVTFYNKFSVVAGGPSTPGTTTTNDIVGWGNASGSSLIDLGVGLSALLQASNNLSDLANAATARTNLGLGTAATQNTGTSGGTLGLLNANKTDSGANTYSGGSLTISEPLSISSPLSAPAGGTGVASPTAHSILVGEGASPVNRVGPNSTSGIPLLSAGSSADPAFGALNFGNPFAITGNVQVANGGTGIALPTAHNLLVAEGSFNFNLLAPPSTVGVPLVSTGPNSDPGYGPVVLSASGAISGLTPTANGGTGANLATAGAANEIIVMSSSTALSQLAVAANSVLATNGSNVPALTQTLPTAVQSNITGFGTVTSGTLSSFATQMQIGLSTSSVTITSGMCGSKQIFSNTGGSTVVIPTGLTGCDLSIAQLGSGSTALSAASGVTLLNSGCTTGAPRAQYSLIALVEIIANEFILGGDCK